MSVPLGALPAPTMHLLQQKHNARDDENYFRRAAGVI